MAIRRIIIELDLQTLPFDQLHEATGAIAVLEGLAKREAIVMQVSDVRGMGKARKPRSDAVTTDDRAIQPQTAVVLDYLRRQDQPLTVGEISAGTSIGENSVRAQLNIALTRGLVTKEPMGKDNTPGARKKLWSIVE